ncbi:unnamed protein product, partial [marine sediment metagenome]
VLKFTKITLLTRIKEIIPKIIFKRPFALRAKSKDSGKRTTAKIAKLFVVPIVLKEENFVKSNGKRKIL